MYYVIGFINGKATIFQCYKTKRGALKAVERMEKSGVYSDIKFEYRENTNVFTVGIECTTK